MHNFSTASHAKVVSFKSTGESLDLENRERIEARLRYANDLGLGPFYLNRSSTQTRYTGSAEQAPNAANASRPSEERNANALSIAASAPATVAASPKRSASAVSAVAKSAPASPSFVPAPSGLSLFDERIEGDSFEQISEAIGGNCVRCKLHKGRTKLVFGVGNPKAELVFVGEGPGRDEDLQGEPFVGRAGKLLTQMIEAMSLRREDVYICNVVKCRPPENRLPEKDEIITCSPFLMRQLAVIQPKVICCLGSCSAQTLLQTTQGISRFRGEWFDFRGSKLIATYHPAYLLRNPSAKGEVWKDLQKVMAILGLQPKRK
jgi:uracil-DNA glycosylase family 4